MSTGKLIEAARKKRKLTRSELAKLLETKRLQVWRVEVGKRLLNTEELETWAKALGCKPADLVR